MNLIRARDTLSGAFWVGILIGLAIVVLVLANT